MSCSSVSKCTTRHKAAPHLTLRHRLATPRRPTVTAMVASPYSQPRGFVADDLATSTTSPGLRVPSSVGDEYFSSDSRPVILFDGVCNMCNAGVNMVLDFDSRGSYRFAALQSDAGRKLLQKAGRHPDDISSIVVVSKDSSWTKSAAVMKIAEGLDMPFPIAGALGVFVPGSFRDLIYDWVAEHRYRIMGERDSCRLMQPEWKDRFLY